MIIIFMRLGFQGLPNNDLMYTASLSLLTQIMNGGKYLGNKQKQ